jgi:predicted nucleic acid-binding Zn ribbon protein
MSLRSLRQLLGNPTHHPPAVQQFQHLVKLWAEVAGASVAAQSRPISIDRGVLYVATASSAWAQDLMFKRRRLLQQLNARLSDTSSEFCSEPLSDIRFSPAQWQDLPVDRPALGSTQQAQEWAEHPSRLPIAPEASELGAAPQLVMDTPNPENPENLENLENSEPQVATPIAAFEQWATQVRSRSQTLPLCPKCDCPTPAGELQRWQVCGVCAAKQWQE